MTEGQLAMPALMLASVLIKHVGINCYDKGLFVYQQTAWNGH